MSRRTTCARIDPSELAPGDRLAELAIIFAAGIGRLRKIRAPADHLDESARETPEKNAAERLELSAETVLSVHTG